MVLYPYRANLAFDPVSNTKAANATGEVYALGDTTFSAPLQPVDASGGPVTLTTTADGILPTFYLDGYTAVNWKSGDWVFPLVTSEPVPGEQGPQGVSVDGATVTGDDLVLSLSDGSSMPPVKLPTAPGGSDAGVASYITTPGTETNTVLSATIDDHVSADIAPIQSDLSAVASDLAVRQKALMGIGEGQILVADRNHTLGAGAVSATTDRQCFSSYAHRVYHAFGSLRLAYSNYHGGPNEAPTADVTVKASVEHPVNAYTATMDPAPVQVTFNGGSTSVVVPYGKTVVSDPIMLQASKGQIVYSNTYITAPAQFAVGLNTMPSGVGIFPELAEGTERGATATDRTAGGTTRPTGGAAYAAGFGPSALLGSPISDRGLLPVSLFGAGDSIMQASADGAYWQGFLARAARAADLPFINVGHQSEKFSQVIPGGVSSYGGDYNQRLPLSGLCNVWVCEYGRNDDAAQPLATLQEHALKFWRMLAAVSGRGYQTTLHPVTSSTDRWTTLAGQTVDSTYVPRRTAFNNWLRDGAPISSTTGAPLAVGAAGIRYGQEGHPLAGHLEIADSIESARDSGKWKVPYKSFTDGNLKVGSKSIRSATAGFTAADLGHSILILDGGGAGVNLLGEISEILSATEVRYERAAGAAADTDGVTAYVGVTTDDGTHPTTSGHIYMAAAIDAASL